MLFQEELTGQIIGCAVEVHSRLGPGLLESPYETALCVELRHAGLQPQRQGRLPVQYRGTNIGVFRADLIVDGKVLVEVKSVERFDPVFHSQLLTYLRISGLSTGLLINFNKVLLKEGIKRFVL